MSRDVTEWVEWSWVHMVSGGRLHHAELIDIPKAYEVEGRGSGRTTCGRSGWLVAPGLFSRMGMPRCARCCDRLGIPRGIGSPKNDPGLGPWVHARLAKLNGGSDD